MSTNKTTNYQLHSWVPEDTFLLSEMNENFEKLDEALNREVKKLGEDLEGTLKAVTGSYQGDGEKSRDIALDGKPLAVIVEERGGYRTSGVSIMGGLITREMALGSGVQITDTGFATSYADSVHMNAKSKYYSYIAFFVRA